ncbi:hypothetical protein RJT34_19196 [Clitoria ternatea]|uniref:mannan endo-1,4-beta-mannosidase n=1 Tax=Clitoria ternatea TaxID=43366 RepID=A0AAN9P3B1_CLITE
MGLRYLVLIDLLLSLMIFGQYGNYKVNADPANSKPMVNSGFIQRNGTHFIQNGKPYYINGFNAYWLMTVASDQSTMSKVTTTFKEASQHGLNVARTWAFDDGGNKAFQTAPGSYNENVFKGLDFVISEAGKIGVRLILSFVNNWNDYGGKSMYLQWARENGHLVTNDDDFFTNPFIQNYYKNHVKNVLTRKNTITGLAYKDDPTIFAWELMNEPRTQFDVFGKSIQNWVSEMAAYVKSIDNNHLLEVGLEGFYGETMPEKRLFNPGFQIGTDFISNNQVPEIDFATIHIYADEWVSGTDEEAQNAFVDKWLPAHIQDSNDVLKMPIVVTEFGMSSKASKYTVDKRNNYFRKVYDFIYNSSNNGGPCAGGLFRQLMAKGVDYYHDGYEIIFEETPSSTISLITQQSQRLSILK